MAATQVASLFGVVELQDKATGPLQAISKAFGGLGSMIGGLSLAGIFTAAIGEASDMEGQLAQLDARLKSTGGKAGVTRDQVLSLANAFQRTTRYSDDMVVSASNMMLTFTNINKSVFPDAIQAAMDLSTAMGQDLQSSVIQIGKALSDPINGVTALRRVGVMLTDAQEKQIKHFMQINDLASAQKIILGELNTEFGGAAKAAGDTLAGKLDILKNKVADVLEGLGNMLLPGLTTFVDGLGKLIDTIEAAAPGLPSAALGFTALGLAMKSFIVPLAVSLLPVAAPIAAIVGAVLLLKAGWDANWLGVQSFFGGLPNMLAAPLARVQETVQQFVTLLTDPFGGISKQTLNAEFRLAKAGGEDTSGMKQGFDIGERITMAVTQAGPKVAAALQGLFSAGFQLVSTWVTTQAWPTIKTGFESAWNSISGWVTSGGAFNFVSAFGDMIWQAVVWLITKGPEQIQKGLVEFAAGAEKWLKESGVGNFINGIAEWIRQAAAWITGTGVPQIGEAFQKVVDKILEIAGQIVNAIVGPIRDEINRLLGLAGEFAGKGGGGQSGGGGGGGSGGAGDFEGVHGPGTWIVGTGAQPELFTTSRPVYGVPNVHAARGGGGNTFIVNNYGPTDATRLADQLEVEYRRRNWAGAKA